MSAGRHLGNAFANGPRTDFEEALAGRVGVLSDLLASSSLDADEAIAAFDHAARNAWQAAQPEAAADVG